MNRYWYLLLITPLFLCAATSPPFNIAITVTPVGGETVFDNSGVPWSFFNQVPAINYDKGGQNLGYNVPAPGCQGATCVSGSSTYRADDVNFKASTFAGIAYQLGSSAIPNSYNYQINISQAGPYKISLWLGDTSAGGSWGVLIDGTLVTTVTTPNTGDFGVFQQSTSGNFTVATGNHKLELLCNGGDANFNGCGDIVAWQGAIASGGGNIACDIGPTASAIPATAQAAGLSHCAANWDFKQSIYATQSNWLDCPQNTHPALIWHGAVPGIASVSCNIFQGTDPNTGQTVMHFIQTPADGAGTFMGMQTKVGSTITFGTNNYFVEAAYRIGTSCTAPSNTCGPNGVWTWNDDSVGGHIEWDYMEEYSDQGGFSDGSPGWFSYQANNLPAGYSVFNYHKVSNLVTSDGSTSKVDCGYVDDRLQICASAASHGFSTDPSIYSTKFWQIASTQSGADGLTGNANIEMWLQYIRVWSCPSYQSGACNGSSLFSGSQDGQTLTYWH